MRSLVASFLFLVALGASAQETRDAASFAAWKQQNTAAVAEFFAHLESVDLHAVVEPHELLRSASSWQTCNAEPYAIPPQEQWSSVISVLRLLKELTEKQVLGAFVVHSAYRGLELNKCSGGAVGSAHLRTFAIDLTPTNSEDVTNKLCSFWREHGRE
jgi:Peptidase M15